MLVSSPGKGLLPIRLLRVDPIWLVPLLACQLRLIFHAKGSDTSSSADDHKPAAPRCVRLLSHVVCYGVQHDASSCTAYELIASHRLGSLPELCCSCRALNKHAMVLGMCVTCYCLSACIMRQERGSWTVLSVGCVAWPEQLCWQFATVHCHQQTGPTCGRHIRFGVCDNTPAACCCFAGALSSACAMLLL